MKLIHLSDLHLGKRVNEFSMIDDQKYILKKILGIIDDEEPDGVIMAGDVYDRTVPSAEAVELCDQFLVELSKRKLQVYIIAGNHDSPERLAFGNRLMDASGIHISPVYDGNIEPLYLEDEHGKLAIWMLPFVKPVNVRAAFADPDDGEDEKAEIKSYTEAVQAAVEHMKIDTGIRNILVTHQFVTGASRSDSEERSVGGTDNVDAYVFDGFDYVALGHLHGPQSVGRETVRYCGTPLKYSFSEVAHEKSVTVVEMGAKGDTAIRTVPLIPLRDMKEIRGKYNDIMAGDFYRGKSYETDYMRIILTDEEDIPNAFARLSNVYKNLMKLEYDNLRTRSTAEINALEDVENRTPLDLFSELYTLQNGAPMSGEQSAYMEKLIEEIWEEQK